MGIEEAKVETYLRDQIAAIGGTAYKFSSPARRKVPDRICVMPTGLVMFVECKSADGELSKGQAKELQRLIDMSQPTFVVQSQADVDELVKECSAIMRDRRTDITKAKEAIPKKSNIIGLDGKAL